jgi:hypothetical protein
MTDLPWGSHCCFFYEKEKHLLDILVPFFKAGLLHNEFCIWVTSKFPEPNEAIRAMRKALPNLDSYLKKGQLKSSRLPNGTSKRGFSIGRECLADGSRNTMKPPLKVSAV